MMSAKTVISLVLFLVLCKVQRSIGQDGEDSHRLVINAIPQSYDILLEPSFDDFTFTGTVNIVVKNIKYLTFLQLHSDKLDIDTISVTDNTSKPFYLSHSLNPERQLLTISLNESVKLKTDLTVSISFKGVLNDERKGFYRGNYLDEDGNQHHFAATHFQATFARRAFPCYDEPALKATFKIRIRRSSSMSSISNGNKASETQIDEDIFEDIFEETPRMSTYLVAFFVSDFESKKDGIHEIYGLPKYIKDDRGVYALDLSKNFLEEMEKFTGIPYGMTKITQVGIPDEWFTLGGMENWGLVLYIQTRLFFKDGVTTAAERQKITSIVAHEHAHQWFGNLVSPEFWYGLWLNEGFATYFNFYLSNIVEPGYRFEEQFVTTCVQHALGEDSSNSTRPIDTMVDTPEQIEAIFDYVTYQKAASVLRMVEHFLGMNVFQSGLKKYLEQFNHDAVRESQLWESLQKAVNEKNVGLPKTLTEIMSTWTKQAGYPVVNVTRNAQGKISLSQNRFRNDGLVNSTEVWHIPINWATNDNPNFEQTKPMKWLTTSSETTDISIRENDWVIANIKQTGYYRVNYDEYLWRNIIKLLNSDNFGKIPATNRAQIVDDAFNLAKVGLLSYEIVFDLVKYIKNEVNYIPLYSFFNGLAYLEEMLVESAEYENFKKFISNLLTSAYNTLGTEDKSPHIDKLNRNQVLSWMCKLGHEPCLETMHSRLQKINETKITPDLQSVVYCQGMVRGTREDFDKLFDLYESNTTESLERIRILSGLGCSRDKYLISNLLASAPYVFEEDRSAVFTSALSGSLEGLDVSLDYLIQHFSEMELPVKDMAEILKALASKVSKKEHMERVVSFLESLRGGQFKSVVEKSLSTIKMNENWKKKHQTTISTWLGLQFAQKNGATSVSLSYLLFILSALQIFLK